MKTVEVTRPFVAGGIANEFGDIWGTSTDRVIQFGKVIVDAARADEASQMGWRMLEKAKDSDPDFAYIERGPDDRRRFGVV